MKPACLAGNADAIILGCTEIPLALPEKELGGVPLIDATDILALELVRAFAPEKLRDRPNRRNPRRPYS